MFSRVEVEHPRFLRPYDVIVLVHAHDLDLRGFGGTKGTAAASAAASAAAGCKGWAHGARTAVDAAANATLS